MCNTEDYRIKDFSVQICIRVWLFTSVLSLLIDDIIAVFSPNVHKGLRRKHWIQDKTSSPHRRSFMCSFILLKSHCVNFIGFSRQNFEYNVWKCVFICDYCIFYPQICKSAARPCFSRSPEQTLAQSRTPAGFFSRLRCSYMLGNSDSVDFNHWRH